MDNSQEKIKVISSLPARLKYPDNEDDTADFYPIINIQKAVYEAHINDLQSRTERLHNRNQQAKNQSESLLDSTKYQNNENEKEFVELNISIASEIKRIDEDKKIFTRLEKLRENQRLNHFHKVKYMIENFEKKRIELCSQVKELNAQINTIENYKLTDAYLKLKYKDRNESISQKEQRNQDILNQMEYKSKIYKENLKKEAYKKVLDTSDSFQCELQTIVPLTVQRLMRENIILQSELFRLRTDRDKMAKKLFIHKNQTAECKKKVTEHKINTTYQIIALKIQKLLLKKLKTAYFIVKKVLFQSYKAPENYENKYLKLLEEIKNSEYFNYEFRQKKLEILFHQEIIKLGFVNRIKSRTLFILKNLSKVLSNLKKCINSAISIDSLNGEENLKKIDLEDFIFYLLEIINNYEFKKWKFDSKSAETVLDSRNLYANGDLGFEPKYIEINEINEKIEKIISTHSTSTIFEEFDKLSDKLIKQKSLNLLSQKNSINSVSIDTSIINNAFFNKTNTSLKESIYYNKNKEMEEIFNVMSDNEEDESEFEFQDKYEYNLNYRQE